MSRFVIILNDIRGVDLIVQRLRESGCIASAELASGIENNLYIMEDDGNLTQSDPEVEQDVELTPVKEKKESKVVHPFQVINGGKSKH